MVDWGTVLSSVIISAIGCSALGWLCREWISARLRKSIQHEYDVKLEGFKAGYQKVLDENRIAFSWWHEAQAKAIQETYSHIAELSFSIDNKLSCAAQQPSCSDCDSAVKESYKKAKKNLGSQ